MMFKLNLSNALLDLNKLSFLMVETPLSIQTLPNLLG